MLARVAGLALGLCSAGCGLLGGERPGGSARAPSAAAAIARAERTHELATPVPASASAVSGGWRTAQAAVASFAAVYVNWTAATVSARLRALARASLGQARAELSGEAAAVARDAALAEGGIANQGTVEAVARLPGAGERWVVVTRERTTSTVASAYRGLAAQWHVSVATTTRTGRGLWVVSAWQPES